ncbi:DHS-like NAD/FAD-binding domain-containing protein [Crepidotus variabilis]|uniref:DHS-like NAD/FAD-binding domain-containing protein n=1 Tax=Crepidotus variabilis TaxID=179855 RepID=A0A9P6EF92_9AGAR|nr:DHS-like NAD/FAD-binding domain-containing protein [Crepidotus variabilis]
MSVYVLFFHPHSSLTASLYNISGTLTRMPSDSIPDFRAALLESKQILVVTGAGLSAASGIPTFRGDGGLWRNYDVTALATPGGWAENQSRVWQFYHYRRELVLKASPNPAHYVLAKLAIPDFRYKIAPHSKLTHVTQNIDGLLRKAVDETKVSSGVSEESSEIVEMHGRLFDIVCTAHDCEYHEAKFDSPICPALGGTEKILADGITEPLVRRADLPHCPLCGQLCRPGVVWFGERPYRIKEILDLADEADLCIVVGTSALVQPASKLSQRVKDHGGRVAVFNLEQSNHSEEADFLFLGPCEQRLGEVFGETFS